MSDHHVVVFSEVEKRKSRNDSIDEFSILRLNSSQCVFAYGVIIT